MVRSTHLSTGGRYPVLRTIAILYLIAAVLSIAYGIWRAVDVLVNGQTPDNFFGAAPESTAGRLMVAGGWLGASFFSALAMVAVAELIKLFIDIEHNTREAALVAHPATGASATMTDTSAPVTPAGDAKAGGRLAWVEGEETAEGALLRGH
jgi:hypothetical protein